MSAKPWTDAHQREALARTYEIAAEIVREKGTAPRTGAGWIANLAEGNVFNEEAWRTLLRPGNAGLDVERIDREVRRVRALAEGRLIRDVRWKIRVPGMTWYGPYDSREKAVEDLAGLDHAGIDRGARIVCFTRIRRAR